MILPCQRLIDLKKGWAFEYTKAFKWANVTFDFIKSNKCFLYTSPNKITTKNPIW